MFLNDFLKLNDCGIPDMDSEVWPLVKLLNWEGILTLASCRGDYVISGETHTFPWVLFRPSPSDYMTKRIDQLREILPQFLRNDVQWSVLQANLEAGISHYNRIQPITKAPIEVLQGTIPYLVDYIFYNMSQPDSEKSFVIR